MNKKIINNLDEILSKIDDIIENAPVVSFIAVQSNNPFKVLISTILSSRTKDATTLSAVEKLFSEIKTPSDLMKLDRKKIQDLIYPVGFYKNKSKFLKETSEILVKNYDSKVPETMDQLLELPGVGRKTANLVLTEAFNKEGMCVDTHVHRISNRFGLINTDSPKESEFKLREILPKKYWGIYNYHLVGLGQTICRPISPKCDECPIYEYCDRINVDDSN
ncbi:MAG: endonuclease III domain-containing protein [Candidatus Woesearchaeota archaeon]